MKTKIIPGLVLSLMITLCGYAQDYHVRVGFFGNSITIGTGLSDPANECYPSQIAKLLETKYGDTCIVKNFAVSGHTMLKNGDEPLWDELFFKAGWSFAPDITFICLGTNDTKSWNWDSHKGEFIGDYLAMIDTFKLRNPNTKIIVCYPPPAFGIVYGIRDSVIINGVIPAVDSILKIRDVTLVDFYHPLVNSSTYFPDKIHPDAAGAKVMAKIAYDRIVETEIIHKTTPGTTFVTSLGTNKSEIKLGDTATISWTTANADTVFLNGEGALQNGSLKVSPKLTTIFKLVAKGKLGNDSLTIQQSVYQPALTKIGISPTRKTIKEGDSVDIKIYYYDQKSLIMEDTIIDGAIWSIPEGGGILIDETNTSTTFVGTTIGKNKVQVVVNNISVAATITVEAGSGIKQTMQHVEQYGFPNPCIDIFNLPIEASGTVKVKIYDITGRLQIQKQVTYESTGNHVLPINVENLKPGMYLYDAEYSGTHITGKLNKQ